MKMNKAQRTAALAELVIATHKAMERASEADPTGIVGLAAACSAGLAEIRQDIESGTCYGWSVRAKWRSVIRMIERTESGEIRQISPSGSVLLSWPA